MQAFDFILVLFSFVYAAAVTHVLSTAGAIIIASKRIRLSWFNMDVGRTVVHLRVVDRPVGFARSKVLGHWVDRILLLDCGGHLSQRRSRLAFRKQARSTYSAFIPRKAENTSSPTQFFA